MVQGKQGEHCFYSFVDKRQNGYNLTYLYKEAVRLTKSELSCNWSNHKQDPTLQIKYYTFPLGN